VSRVEHEGPEASIGAVSWQLSVMMKIPILAILFGALAGCVNTERKFAGTTEYQGTSVQLFHEYSKAGKLIREDVGYYSDEGRWVAHGSSREVKRWLSPHIYEAEVKTFRHGQLVETRKNARIIVD
tara:strand:+ start:1131 stop:1508 length:378 start_codon:yes stop_codon:yes gene_type:complete